MPEDDRPPTLHELAMEKLPDIEEFVKAGVPVEEWFEDYYLPAFEEAEEDAEWSEQVERGVAQLDQELGRPVTERELQAIEDQLDGEPFPALIDHEDVGKAYERSYAGREDEFPDLDTAEGRKKYMEERFEELNARAEAEDRASEQAGDDGGEAAQGTADQAAA